jgi:hypothetical protein
MQGRWVLIEDIDKGSFEVIAALASLLEHRTLNLQGRGTYVCTCLCVCLYVCMYSGDDCVSVGFNSERNKCILTEIHIDD